MVAVISTTAALPDGRRRRIVFFDNPVGIVTRLGGQRPTSLKANAECPMDQRVVLRRQWPCSKPIYSAHNSLPFSQVKGKGKGSGFI